MSNDNYNLTSFLASAIEHFENYSLQYDKINQGEGKGFLSQIIFLTLTHRKSAEKIHITIKQPTIHEDGTFDHYVDTHFQNEIRFYQNIWPFLNEYYLKKTNKVNNFIPKCYGTSPSGIYRIALENLRENGYNSYDGTEYLDEQHFRIIFQTYGIFHGISMALRINKKEKYKDLTDNLTSRWRELYEDGKIIAEMTRTVTNYLKQFFDPITESKAIEKLEMYSRIGPNLIRDCLDYTGANAVIVHGDCWSNNLMFKYDENEKPRDVKLLDFQIISSGSPVFDLSYCLYSGGNGKSFNDLELFLKLYHQSLCLTLEEFDLDANKYYPYSTLKEEWMKYCKFGFAMTLFVSRLKLVDEGNIPDLKNYDGHPLEPFAIPCEREATYKQNMSDLVLHMCNSHFL